MPRVLFLRIPAGLHERLRDSAHDNHTSLNQHCAALLEKSLAAASSPNHNGSANPHSVGSTPLSVGGKVAVSRNV